MKINELRLENSYIGAKVTILARVMKVTDYVDVRTRKYFEELRSHTFAMIKPDSYNNLGNIID